MDSREKLLTKDFFLLFATMFCGAGAFLLLLPIVPLFAMKEIQLEEGSVGIVVGCFAVSAVTLRPFIGYALDNYYKKTVLLVALGLFLFAITSFLYVATFAVLLAIRMLQGGGWSAVTTSTSTIIADIVPASRRNEGIGLFSIAIPLAMVLGPALGMFIYEHTHNFDITFSVSACLAVLSLITASLIKIPRVVRERRKLKLSFGALYEKRALGLALLQYGYSFVYGGIVTFVPIYTTQMKIGNNSLFFMFYGLSVISSRLFVRKMFDIKGPQMIVGVGIILFASGTLLLSFVYSTPMLFLCAILAGLGGGMMLPTINAMTMNIVEPQFRGKANATIFTAVDLGMGSGAVVLGYLAEHTSFPIMYKVAAAFLLVPFLWFFLFERKRYKKNLAKLETIK